MKQQPTTLAHDVAVNERHNTVNIFDGINTENIHRHAPRTHFTRSTLFTALATSLVGFGIAPTAVADTVNQSGVVDDTISNQIVVNEPSTSQTSTERAPAKKTPTKQSATLSEDDTQVDIALDALRLKKAVEQGLIDQSVLDDYSEESLGIKNSNAQKTPASQSNPNANVDASVDANVDADDKDGSDNVNGADSNPSDMPDTTNEDLLQQATAIQQQGYQMMTPEEIDRELAELDRQNAEEFDAINNSNNANGNEISANGNVDDNIDSSVNDNINDSDFDAPIATLGSTTVPMGLDTDLDSTNLPTPSNLDTLGKNETAAKQAETSEVASRPVNVSDSVSSGRVDDVTDSSDDLSANANEASDNQDESASNVIDPDEYLPDYQ
ncbi:MAG: outer membrane protein assembly factor, partial [Psychrobacter sp.]